MFTNKIKTKLTDTTFEQRSLLFAELSAIAYEDLPSVKKKAAKLGFTRAIIPKANQAKQKIKDIEILPVETLSQALDLIKR